MVIDEAWRAIPHVEPLSNADGGPLRRTVKLILDPLVIRPVQNKECAGPLVTAAGAATVAERIADAAPRLQAAAAWFAVFKKARRGLRIVDGNPQDLYFQRCFELAVTSGMPGDDAEAAAARILREIHDTAGGRTTRALREYVAEPAQSARLTRKMVQAWSSRPVERVDTDVAGQVTVVLDGCPTVRIGGASAVAEDAFDALIEAAAGRANGIGLWFDSARAEHLGLTIHPVPHRPELGSSAATATLGLPFDRTVVERVFTVLQASSDRADLPDVAGLVDAEIDRCCSPWALGDESLRVVATVGMHLALDLHPVRARRVAANAAARVIDARWQREAYVLQARRFAIREDAELPATNPLAAIVADLRTPWRPYLRRLWVRLHGKDVRGMRVYDIGELWDLLDGVARSVILDHRMRVKQALGAEALADPIERAS